MKRKVCRDYAYYKNSNSNFGMIASQHMWNPSVAGPTRFLLPSGTFRCNIPQVDSYLAG